MGAYPDFSAQGLQIIEELGRNPVAQGGSWDGYKEIEREIQALKDLQHPGILRYLGRFETGDRLGAFHFGATQTLTWLKRLVVRTLVRTGANVKCTR
ncbi:MAG: hypothetical protein VKK80_02660 [Prochlorothrix sp.]|nr:hypothetical protein [Prochlorothrix sp.]